MPGKIDGTKIASEIIERSADLIKENGLRLKLSIVLSGNDPASLSYVSQKEKACQEAGIKAYLYKFPGDIGELDLAKEVEKISRRSSGVIVQLPLPLEKDQIVLNAVPRKKDIDVLSEESLGRFYSGDFRILPPVVAAVSYILEREKISPKRKYIVLIGAGKLVGKPLSIWLMKQGATISVLNRLTKDISSFTNKADILISGAGKPGLIKGNMIKKGAVAIDAGSSFRNGKIRGDFDWSVYKKARLFTAVPGGVGPITSACLIENLVKLNLP